MAATDALHVVNEVTTPQEARAAVQAMAAKHIGSVKIWVDDRRGTYPKLSPETVKAIIDEAHAHQMKVNAHATTLPDQKEVVRRRRRRAAPGAGREAGRRVPRAAEREEALLGDRHRAGDRTEVCEHDPFFDEALPAKLVAEIRRHHRTEAAGALLRSGVAQHARREEIVAYNFLRR